MSLNKKGFTLIESLFAFSIFTTVIILLVSLYVTNSKTNIKVNQEYSYHGAGDEVALDAVGI